MTSLLDSGELETDDLEVAACFFRKKVIGKIAIHVALHHSGEFVLSDVRNLGWSSGVGDSDGNWWDLPIRIPAATVAEVTGWDSSTTADLTDAWQHVTVALGGVEAGGELFQWLRKHIQEV